MLAMLMSEPLADHGRYCSYAARAAIRDHQLELIEYVSPDLDAPLQNSH